MYNLYNSISFRTSEQITRSYSTSFYTAVKILEPKTKQAIFSIYGFVRLADEIVDTFYSTNQMQWLDDFQSQFVLFF